MCQSRPVLEYESGDSDLHYTNSLIRIFLFLYGGFLGLFRAGLVFNRGRPDMNGDALDEPLPP